MDKRSRIRTLLLLSIKPNTTHVLLLYSIICGINKEENVLFMSGKSKKPRCIVKYTGAIFQSEMKE